MKTCLVVDDSRVVRKVAGGIMTKLGFSIAEAEDGEKAYIYCTQQFPDLILLDWYMPVLDGIGFLEKLRAMPGGDKPVVIMCTTENNMTNIQKAIMTGANEYVMKPFDEGIISSKLSQVGML
jgi:two-component system, chemotaxis family, chemotaxis protein CheY